MADNCQLALTSRLSLRVCSFHFRKYGMKATLIAPQQPAPSTRSRLNKSALPQPGFETAS
jgi:hypothetical protein